MSGMLFCCRCSEAAARGFLKISQNSQQNTCVGISYLIKLQACNFIFTPAILFKMRLRHRCFPVNFEKSLRAPFLQNTSGRLLAFVDFKLIQQVNLVFLVLTLNK